MSGIGSSSRPLNLPLGVGILSRLERWFILAATTADGEYGATALSNRRRRRRVPHSNRMIRGRPTLSGDRRNTAIAIPLYGNSYIELHIAADKKPPRNVVHANLYQIPSHCKRNHRAAHHGPDPIDNTINQCWAPEISTAIWYMPP